MKLQAQIRENHGRRSCQQIRKKGFYPAVMYGKKTSPTAVQVSQRIWDSFMRTHAVRLQPFEIELSGKTYAVLVKDIKRSTASQKIEHLDFYTIESNKPIDLSVPLRYINQEESIGLKEGGVLSQQLHELEISALPKNIPSSIEVDIANLSIGDVLHISDIVLPEGCTLSKAVAEDYNPLVASIDEQRAEEADSDTENSSDATAADSEDTED